MWWYNQRVQRRSLRMVGDFKTSHAHKHITPTIEKCVDYFPCVREGVEFYDSYLI